MQIGQTNYNRVSPRMPCPICKRKSYCLVSDDGNRVICTKHETQIPYQSYNGWLHVNGSYIPSSKVHRTKDYSHDPAKVIEAYQSLDFSAKALKPLADHLQVPVRSLQMLAAGFDGTNWNFPMYDGSWTLTGLKRRNLKGKKWCLGGSRLGVYLPYGIKLDRHVYVVEGESDTAAMHGQMFNVLGRPSAESGLMILVKVLQFAPSVTIVVDNDQDHVRQEAKAGALKLADRLKCPVDFAVVTRYKDIRAWINSGKFDVVEFHDIIKEKL